MLTVEEAEELQKSLAGKLIAEKSARLQVNRFILENLRDSFCAGRPRFVLIGQEPVWSVPVVFAYPEHLLGEVGEVLIQAVEGSILGFTPPAEIYRNAGQLQLPDGIKVEVCLPTRRRKLAQAVRHILANPITRPVGMQEVIEENKRELEERLPFRDCSKP